MAQLISEIWAGLREAGMPEVMLYLPDNSASRCHWDDTTMINDVRVALLADQDRQIVRILPVDSCVGIGIASPKGVDSSGYKLFVQKKIRQGFSEPEAETEPAPVMAAAPVPQAPLPPAVTYAPEPPAARSDPLTSRFGVAMRPQASPSRFSGSAQGGR
jgi:hypothetical protein